MPLIAAAYLVFAAGLLIGYARFGLLPTAGAAAAGIAGLYLLLDRHRLSRVALSLAFAGAISLAAADSVPTRLSVAQERNKTGKAGILVAARERAGRAIDRTFGTDAPLARALLIADRQQIPLEMNDAFVAAGLVHILSISGLHVGIIAMAITLLLESARFSRRSAAMATLVAVAVYVAILGAPPPALRAAAMVCAVTIGRLAQRPSSPWALLAIGAFIPLVQPQVISDIGYQLSVGGMASLIAAGAFSKRWLKPRLSGFRLTMAREISTSVLATLISAPPIAWAFGRISLVGPLSNLAAGPIVLVLQPLLFLALVVAPITPVARFVADAAHPLLGALNTCAVFFSSIPGASVSVAPSWAEVVCFIAAACSLLVGMVSRFPARALITSAACCSLGMFAPFPVLSSGMLEMHMLDVGQGDAILLRTPPGNWILMDAGRAWSGGDAGRSVVVPYVKRRGGELRMFILSHPHLDHVGGAPSILRSLHPDSYWDGAFPGGSAVYRISLDVADKEKISWRRAHPGDSVNIDGVTLDFLAPDSTWTAALKEANEASTVVMVRFGAVRFLLTGDAEQNEENWLETHSALPLAADVLKVGHHGSSTSSSDEFIGRVCPRLALISVGAKNKYGHPSGDVIAALRNLGARVLRTDEEGTIVVRTDGRTIQVRTAEKNWELSPPQPDLHLERQLNCRVRS